MARGVTFKMRIRVKYEEAKSDNIIWYRWIKRAIDFSAEASNDQEGGRKVSLAICDIQRFYSLTVHFIAYWQSALVQVLFGSSLTKKGLYRPRITSSNG